MNAFRSSKRVFGSLVPTLDQIAGEYGRVDRPGISRTNAVETSNAMRISSIRRSSTPQAKAPRAPPPWSARLTGLLPNALPARMISGRSVLASACVKFAGFIYRMSTVAKSFSPDTRISAEQDTAGWENISGRNTLKSASASNQVGDAQ
jgi:hypothetical protein